MDLSVVTNWTLAAWAALALGAPASALRQVPTGTKDHPPRRFIVRVGTMRGRRGVPRHPARLLPAQVPPARRSRAWWMASDLRTT
jgi:hypothetical protein